MKRLIKNSFLVRKTIGLFIISLFFSFFVYMGGALVIRSSKTFDQLNHIEGRITDTRFIKRKYSGKFKAGYKSVLVLSVEGSSDEFGFLEGSKAYKTFSTSGKLVKMRIFIMMGMVNE